ncbi:hypothetical protein HPB47_017213 [Ixodes persulcatus]|uniref:Uncharacterized protein n=1 Tax=Ixodes persulcatus TaxID=34615 RepID=A0AC60QSF7_IXOPE|nr:hypothetical protein HPB47_017213 [Ixodes persulcatus]
MLAEASALLKLCPLAPPAEGGVRRRRITCPTDLCFSRVNCEPVDPLTCDGVIRRDGGECDCCDCCHVCIKQLEASALLKLCPLAPPAEGGVRRRRITCPTDLCFSRVNCEPVDPLTCDGVIRRDGGECDCCDCCHVCIKQLGLSPTCRSLPKTSLNASVTSTGRVCVCVWVRALRKGREAWPNCGEPWLRRTSGYDAADFAATHLRSHLLPWRRVREKTDPI